MANKKDDLTLAKYGFSFVIDFLIKAMHDPRFSNSDRIKAAHELSNICFKFLSLYAKNKNQPGEATSKKDEPIDVSPEAVDQEFAELGIDGMIQRYVEDLKTL